MQIKVNLDQNIYEGLKISAKQHRRTLSAELNTILEEQLLRPGIQSIPTTPVPGPGIPTTPYQVTATTTAGLSQPVQVTAPTQTFTTTTATTPAKPKKSIIGDVDEYGNLIETPPKTETKTEEKTYSSLPDIPTHTNPLKEKVKIYLDTYDVNPKDHSMATYKKLKEKFTKLDLETFDKIQHERAGD